MSWLEAALRWYAVLAAMTWAFAPAVRWLCNRLPDRGVSLVRPIAMLAAVYPAWFLSSLGLAGFHGAFVWVAIVIVGCLGWFFTLRSKSEFRFWTRGLLVAEIGSLALFAAYLWLRGFTPQILGTEKPMDVAFLASSMRAVAMPPPDPWFAGEPINYYYLGYLLHGTVGRLAEVPPEIGFNLALATVFSTTVVAAFGLLWNVVSPWSGRVAALAVSAFAAFGLAVAGNLYAPMRLLQDAPATMSAWWWAEEGIGWRSSRIVCDGLRVGFRCPSPATETITEFPFFSFLLGDLHPHLMALPYSLVAIGLAWNLWRIRAGTETWHSIGVWLRIALSGAVAGALYPLNAWDFPTYLLLMAVALHVGLGLTPRAALGPLAVLGASAILPWLPFLAGYVPPTTDATATGLGEAPVVSSLLSAFALHLGERTSLAEYLTIFGVPYLFGIALLAASWKSNGEQHTPVSPATIGAIGAATLAPGVILSAPVIPLCGIPLAFALIVLRRHALQSPRAFALTLFAFAWALSIGVEIVYVRDAFDDRMNTLFKFYFQAWTLYAIGAAAVLAVLWAAARAAWPRAVLTAVAVASVIVGAAYPLVASYQWTEGFAAWQGLDGLAYGEIASPDDVAAIRWLGERAAPGDVVLEAAGCSYYPFGRLPFSRVSAFTGIPTIVGWGNHERQWRAGQPDRLAEIAARQADVAAIYADPAGALADEFRVAWLFVGEYETGEWRAECETAGPYRGIDSANFPGPGWEEAFRAGATRVYRRLPR